MKWLLIMAGLYMSLLMLPAKGVAQKNYRVYSPDKKLELFIDAGRLEYTASYNGKRMIDPSPLGLKQSGAPDGVFHFQQALSVRDFRDTYRMLNAKKSRINVAGTERTFVYRGPGNLQQEIIFRVTNDGFAFRYHLLASGSDSITLESERTSIKVISGSKAWIQPMAEERTGWEQTNPSYEEYYLKGVSAVQSTPPANGWVFPALFQVGPYWMAVTEAGLGKQNSAASLQQGTENHAYRIKQHTARVALPFQSSWKVFCIGTLKTLTESTLGTDMADPSVVADTRWIHPGKAAWSWAIYKDDSTIFTTQKRFAGYAADMKWQYLLIDAGWDKSIGYDSVKMLADYAAGKNVGVWVWYNSAGNWNTVTLTPKDKLLTAKSRKAEFARLQKMGIKGLKIDFFGGDHPDMIRYYIDILEDAARYKLLVNFHGCTLPRGWQRTYPHLMTMESVKGFEFITFDQKNADEEPAHAAILPFTRNLFDPMDFTPMSLSEIPNIKRVTTAAFELALPVIFLSGIQHFAETPEGMQSVPGFVKNFLQKLPDYWDDTRFIDGFPGTHYVVARRSGNNWYVAGINGTDQPKQLELDLSFLGVNRSLNWITDGEFRGSFMSKELKTNEPGSKMKVTLAAYGGFTAATR